MGYCTDWDISSALAKNGEVKTVNLNDYPMDMVASNLISPEVARRYNALPIGFSEDNKSLIVAMKSANDIIAIDDLRIMTGYDIEPVIVQENQLKVAIDQFDGMSTNIESIKLDEEVHEEEPDTQQSDGQERPAVQLANQIINYAIKAGASDIHVEPMEKKLKVRFRIDGVLHEVMQQPNSIKSGLSFRIKVFNMDIAERRIPQDGRISKSYEGKIVDVRARLPTSYVKRSPCGEERSAKVIHCRILGFKEAI